MSSTDLQLYGNNAKSTLLLSINPTDTVFSVAGGEGSRFPAITASNQFFLVTLEVAGVIEICKVTSRVSDTFTVVRAQEGTSPTSFPLGALVQMRVTGDSLARMARLTDRLCDVDSVDLIPSVNSAVGNSFLSQSIDDSGNPIVALKGSGRWRYLTHSTTAVTSTVVSSTTTSITADSLPSMPYSSGRYILNFITGVLAGQTKLVTNIAGSTISWATATTIVPELGSQFEVLVSNAYQISQLSSVGDDSIINALIFGG